MQCLFHNDIDDMLVKEARVEELNEWQRCAKF